MIQRKQTLFFGIALILALFPLFGLDLMKIYINSEHIASVNAYSNNDWVHLKNVTSNIYYIVVIVLLLALFFTILLFKNRKRQLILGWISFNLNVGLSILVLINSIAFKKTMDQNASLSIEMTYFLFASAFLFIFLGIQGVRKDKKLIDSLNRLR